MVSYQSDNKDVYPGLKNSSAREATTALRTLPPQKVASAPCSLGGIWGSAIGRTYQFLILTGECFTLAKPTIPSIQAFSILNQLVVHEPGLLRLVAPTAVRNGPSMSFPCGWLSPAVTTVKVTPGGTEKPLVPRLAEICCFDVTFQILPIFLLFLYNLSTNSYHRPSRDNRVLLLNNLTNRFGTTFQVYYLNYINTTLKIS
jgi:hypothetical protein